MSALAMLVFAAGAGFAVVVVATIVVIIGVSQEERRNSLLAGSPPTVVARLARRVLGVHVSAAKAGADKGESRPAHSKRCGRPRSR